MGCAQQIVETNQGCSICDCELSKSNIRLVTVHQDSSACKLMLCGQAPEDIVASAVNALSFHSEQQRMQQQERSKRQAERRQKKIEEACRSKLEKIYTAYNDVKNRYSAAIQQRTELQRDNEELKDKYNEKANQARNLKDMVLRLQSENKSLITGGSRGGSRHGVSGSGQRPLMPAMGDAHMVTTVQRTEVFDYETSPGIHPGAVSPDPAAMFARRGSMGVEVGRRGPKHAALGGSLENLLTSPPGQMQQLHAAGASTPPLHLQATGAAAVGGSSGQPRAGGMFLPPMGHQQRRGGSGGFLGAAMGDGGQLKQGQPGRGGDALRAMLRTSGNDGGGMAGGYAGQKRRMTSPNFLGSSTLTG